MPRLVPAEAGSGAVPRGATDLMAMLKKVKCAALRLCDRVGMSSYLGASTWRRHKLLILCYHGIAIEDEHLWNPSLYVSASHLEQRLELLRRHHCNVLLLAEAVKRLYSNDLPDRSVVITFDDGTYDFYARAHPLLRQHGLPATVYLTTYHSDHQVPVFRPICSYMLWKRRGSIVRARMPLGHDVEFDLRTPAGRRNALIRIDQIAEGEGLDTNGKHEIAAAVAAILNIDFQALLSKRILHIMTPAEVAEMAEAGVDIQLHTHRHRTPLVPTLFEREIRENSERITAITRIPPQHFCYPSGNHRPEFLEWLAKENVISATTCETGLASAHDHPLLLPRVIDTMQLSPVEFEGWVSGVASLLPKRRVRARAVDSSGRIRLS